MMRLLRASVIALLLLTSAATAYADCAWVLWQQQGEISPSGSVSSSDWTWLTAEATSTEAECRQVSARFDTSLGPTDADGYSTVTSKGKKVRVRNVWPPAGTDPRGAKGQR